MAFVPRARKQQKDVMEGEGVDGPHRTLVQNDLVVDTFYRSIGMGPTTRKGILAMGYSLSEPIYLLLLPPQHFSQLTQLR